MRNFLQGQKGKIPVSAWSDPSENEKIGRTLPLIFLLFSLHLYAQDPDTEKVSAFLNSGNRSAALLICSDNSKKTPRDTSFLLLCLQAAEKKDELPAFLADDCEGLAQSGSPYGYFCLCKINRLRGNNDLSLANCRKALVKDPLYQPVYLEAAKTFLAKGKEEKALEYINTAVAISSSNYKAYQLLGEAYEKSGNYSRAIAAYEKALKLLKRESDPPALEKAKTLKKSISLLKGRQQAASQKLRIDRFRKCRSEYSSIDLSDAESRYRKASECLSYSPSDPEASAELAGAALKLGKYEESVSLYQNALPGIKDKNGILDVTHKLARAWLGLDNPAEAEKALETAYRHGDSDLEYLKIYSELLEKSGNYSRALEVSKYMNGIKSDSVSREIIEALKDRTLTSEQILEDMKKRGALDPSKNFLEPDDRKLFLNIRLAERKGALAQIKKKYQGYANLYIEEMTGKEFTQKLSMQGYKLYLRDISQNAVRFFEKKSIPLVEVFKLRELSGSPIFTPRGELTFDGFNAYFKAIDTGEKTWLRHYEEPVVSSSREDDDEAKTVNEAVNKLLSTGYMEISETEYDWLMMATECPDEVLKSPPCNIKTIKSRGKYRYFICHQDGLCTGAAIKLSLYIADYREGNTEKPVEQKATAFFGSGGGPVRHFCYKNRIWYGEE